MKLKVKKLKPSAIIPTYGSSGAACFDLYSAENYVVESGDTIRVSTGLAFEVPEGFELQVRPRSGISSKTKIRISNSPGCVDSDFRGEVLVIIDNIGRTLYDNYSIKAGDRIAQACVVPVTRVEFEEVENISETVRGTGGFGSTGV